MRKRSPCSDLSPAIASIVMVGSLALFLVDPFSSPRLHALPEGGNGRLYSFGTRIEMVHVTIFRDGAMAIGNRTVSADHIFHVLRAPRSNEDERTRRALRISLHPDALAIREIYEAGVRAEIDAIFFRVSLPQPAELTSTESQPMAASS